MIVFRNYSVVRVEGEEWNERNRGRGLKLRVERRGDKTLYNT